VPYHEQVLYLLAGQCTNAQEELVVCNQLLRLTQPFILRGTENEYRPKCGDALWLDSILKACMYVFCVLLYIVQYIVVLYHGKVDLVGLKPDP